MQERDRPRAHGIRDDRGQLRANSVQLLEQGKRASEQSTAAGDTGRCDERESPDAFGLSTRQLGRDQPTERVADEVDRTEPDRVQKPPEPRGELAGAETPEPGQLDEVKAVMLGEPVGEQ